MCTLVPPRPAKRATEGVTVGLMHPTGARAVGRLADSGIALPPGWVVRQDHARRGLVLLARWGDPESDIIGWALRAGAALCREEMTGQWQAVVYLP
jgi:DNA-binding transcriptional LysR family regulator